MRRPTDEAVLAAASAGLGTEVNGLIVATVVYGLATTPVTVQTGR